MTDTDGPNFKEEIAPIMPACLKRMRATIDIAEMAMDEGNFELAAACFVDLRSGATLTAEVLSHFLDFKPTSIEAVLEQAHKMQTALDTELTNRGITGDDD